MNVYRGPKQTDFDSDLHECTDVCDLSSEARAWDGKVRVEVNISKEAAIHKKAVSTLFFDAKDMLTLNTMLIEALLDELKVLKRKAKEAEKYEKLLMGVRDVADKVHESKLTLEQTFRELRELLNLGENSCFRGLHD